MVRSFHFVKTDPAGNTTILVLDPVKKEDRSAVSRKLMEERSLAAEQVAFLEAEPPRFSDIAIGMMGGEFCGNATRSAAAWLLFDRLRWQPEEGKAEASYEVSCSGMDHNMICYVKRIADNLFDVSASMPHPLSIEESPLHDGALWHVAFAGITHHCFFMKEAMASEEKEAVVSDILVHHPVPHGGAAGILFWDGKVLDPRVYVKDTDTLVAESSCGSGTAAIACAAAARSGGEANITAVQPGGTIEGHCRLRDGKAESLSISGAVRIAAEGIAYI